MVYPTLLYVYALYDKISCLGGIGGEKKGEGRKGPAIPSR